jgi:hypothetical protein
VEARIREADRRTEDGPRKSDTNERSAITTWQGKESSESAEVYQMKTHVEFRSDQFPPYEGEEDMINPGCYGKRLAEFLAAGLKSRGFEPLEPIAEDWGWVLPIKNDGFRLWIGCSSYQEYADGFLCFIEPHRPVIRRFLCLGKVRTSAKIMALQAAIDQVLSANPGIRDKQWWTYEEFNRPRAVTK